MTGQYSLKYDSFISLQSQLNSEIRAILLHFGKKNYTAVISLSTEMSVLLINEYPDGISLERLSQEESQVHGQE